MKVKIKLLSPDAKIPTYAHNTDAGADIYAADNGTYISWDVIEYKTDIAIQLPVGYYGLIYPRSSISKYGLTLCNSTGIIDEEYREEIKLRFRVTDTKQPKFYVKGDRIGQIILQKKKPIEFEQVEELASSKRDGGFGHTGE